MFRTTLITLAFGCLQTSLAVAPTGSEVESSIRGSGDDLEMRLHGRLIDSSGQPVHDASVTASVTVAMKGFAGETRVDATINGNQFEAWLPVHQAQPLTLTVTAVDVGTGVRGSEINQPSSMGNRKRSRLRSVLSARPLDRRSSGTAQSRSHLCQSRRLFGRSWRRCCQENSTGRICRDPISRNFRYWRKDANQPRRSDRKHWPSFRLRRHKTPKKDAGNHLSAIGPRTN